jgi:hypothetical protein
MGLPYLPRDSVARMALCTVLVCTFVFSGQLAAAESSRGRSLIGSFGTSDSYNERNNISIWISVKWEGAGYRLNFQGGGRALHGHAPEGGGHGQIRNGVFHFQFEDSFPNRGSGTFRRVGDRYLLHIEISDIAEPSIMSAYGETPLYRDKT